MKNKFYTKKINWKSLATGAALTAGLVVGSPNISSKGDVSMVQSTVAQTNPLILTENDFNTNAVKQDTLPIGTNLQIQAYTTCDVFNESSTFLGTTPYFTTITSDITLFITPDAGSRVVTVHIIAGQVTSVNSTYDSEFSIYPNPTTDVINIKSDKVGKYEILDISGRVLKTTSDKSIDVSNLPSGKYFLRIGNKTKTFVKQ